jgi:hypothetical protein
MRNSPLLPTLDATATGTFVGPGTLSAGWGMLNGGPNTEAHAVTQAAARQRAYSA